MQEGSKYNLLQTGYSLSCIQCVEATDAPCSGTADVCAPSEDACISKYALTSIGGIQISKLFVRGCGTRSQCSISGSLSIPLSRMVASTTCCYTDRCMPSRPILPPAPTNLNGVVCKTCQGLQDYPCESDEYINCVGNETKCISQFGTTSGAKTALRGCSSPDLCKNPHEEGSFGGLKFSMKITCTDGTATLHYSLYLLSATTIWLFKVMN
ncbi:uncharacterized protein [Eleutherodactylus coqui]|uniref:uncharacterized protein isoform X3 n=1 Tax=Eleutherodactylus coqui TaxID=57060 RepID=UPI003461B4B3